MNMKKNNHEQRSRKGGAGVWVAMWGYGPSRGTPVKASPNCGSARKETITLRTLLVQAGHKRD
jgi:hypothetical protein